MQFDRVEPIVPAAPPACGICSGILSGTYFTVQRRSVCAACGEKMRGRGAGPFDRARFVKALLVGAAAVVVVGGFNWFVASHWDINVGLPSLLASLLVGFVVRWGSGNRGGRAYQVLAVLLSYLTIGVMFVPLVRLREGTLTLASVLEPFWALLVAPFFFGMQGLLLWSIFGFSLSMAWRVNRSLAVEVLGPFTLGSTMPSDTAGQV